MSTTTDQRLNELIDRAELADLLVRQGRWLDERRFDESGEIFTDDVTADTPGGRSAGLEAVVAQARRNHSPSERSQHVTTNVLIELDGDRASVSAELVVRMFTEDEPEPYVTLGARNRFDAVRTDRGWRFSSITNSPLWMIGSPRVPAV
ncbi:nuclear transport factor 2 family protein [Spirillospora sp. CA-294931]|uniref:nuclear transport factor 2 family protein n=1 Tax=Spirillospora sp. CA-294931 TaxID=3240042 RepID=UPI003D8D0F53